MARFFTFILLIITLIAGSCSTRKNQVDSSNMIPEKEFVTILTELYMTDGLLSISKITQMYSLDDTLAAHLDVLKMHGYTKENMDKTLMYYYIKNPKKLTKIYDQVLGTLSEMESIYAKEVTLLETRRSNIWKGESVYFLPDISGNDSANFINTAINPGTYYLSYTVTLSPLDQSYNTRPLVYMCHPDSIETGRKHYIKTKKYIKDGQPHLYNLEIKVLEKSNFYIRGWFYDSESFSDESLDNLRIERINLTFIPGIV